MIGVLNLNITWIPGNFLTYIKHRFSGTVAAWCESLDEEGKNISGMMEISAAIFEKLCEEIELNLSKPNQTMKKKIESEKERLIIQIFGT